jgi:hypothetical protein
MRWSRPQADTPLGELMEGQETDETAPTVAAAPSADDDTAVRAPLADSENALAPGTDSDPAEPEGADSFLDDEDYLPQNRRQRGRLTVALVAALVLAAGVLGGVWVEKQLGTTASAASFGTAQGAPAGGTGAGSGATRTATPAVVGTVSSTGTSSLVVTDAGGTKHDVSITKSTTVTAPYGHGSLKKGDAVAVTGTTGTGGAITATGIAVS